MTKARSLIVTLVVLGFFKQSLQATDNGILPTLTVVVPDVQLNEEEDVRTQLGGGTVVTCADDDGDQIRVYIASISPNSGCGLKCLQLLPCGGAASDYCLWFLASQGSLDYSTSSVYTLTIGCTDDLETVVTDVVTVTLIQNTPPVFNPTTDVYATHGQKTTNSERWIIYEVGLVTTDAEGDPLSYTVSTDPATDFIEIETTSGRIKAAHDFKMLCVDFVEASVWVRDPYSSYTGPFTLDLTIDNYNTPPIVTNLDTTVTIDENEAIDKRVIEFVVDDTKNTDLTYHQWATTSAGMEAYGMRAPSLRTQIELDYEREDTRTTKLYFQLDDEFCRSEIYSLTININDLPEEPKIDHTDMLVMVYEGWINEPNNVHVLDDDLDETFTWTREDDTHEDFDVDQATGNFLSKTEFYLAAGRDYKDHNVRTRAVDKDGFATSKLLGRVRVFDINNNAPYFTNDRNPFSVAAHECLPPGSVLGRVKGEDTLDSFYNQNNWVYFGGGGGKFAIAANGWVVLTEVCANGEVFSGTATIADQGIVPGPLVGEPLEVLLSCGPCPAGGGDGDDDGTGGSNGTDTAGSADSSSGGGGSDVSAVLLWVAPAVVLAAAWLAITFCLMQRFGRNPFKNCCQPKPRPIRVTPEPPQAPPKRPPGGPAPPPPPKPRDPPPPPQPKPPTPQPYLMGFWKETYTNQDQCAPTSKGKPKPIEAMPLGEGNAPPPDHLRLGQPRSGAAMPRFLPGNAPHPSDVAGSPAAPPPEKKKFCTIL